MKTCVYIDGANLHQATKRYQWKFDYKRFFIWLKDKYHIKEAYIFIGHSPQYQSTYTYLAGCGYKLVYKEVSYDHTGKIKGNCDADLVVHAMKGYYEKEFDQLILVSSDGDYASLVAFLKSKGAFLTLITPYTRFSFLLRKLNIAVVLLERLVDKMKKQS